jgi:hypothetical protein
VSDADRLRSFLVGWDAAERCLLATLMSVPAEHLPTLIVHLHERRSLEDDQ